ncbi:MAG TPA: ABC transporter substrate-binding protein, partial [Burkholderiales bacterium]|nr:ABC transporter substrate-binding protein [Burkholderiales bacterium]
MKLSKSALCTALLALGLSFQSAARAEVSVVRVVRQYGVGYLPVMVMQDQHLIQKHAKALGLGDITVRWEKLTDGAVVNDALLSGNLDFASGGIGAFVVLW